MNSRALLLMAAFVTSPGWAQDASFDLHSQAVKNIVRAAAATQFATVKAVEEVKPTIVPKRSRFPEDALVAKKVPTKPPVPRRPPPRQKDTFLSAMVETLV